jgi:hypothetical protein
MHPELTTDEQRRVVKQWHQESLAVIGTEDFGITWGDFLRGRKKIRHPWGVSLKSIIGEIDMNAEMPDEMVAKFYSEKSWRLFQNCQLLAAQANDGIFFLPCRKAGELIGMNHTDASKLLSVLVEDGFIELVSKGNEHKAHRYRCNPPVA